MDSDLPDNWPEHSMINDLSGAPMAPPVTLIHFKVIEMYVRERAERVVRDFPAREAQSPDVFWLKMLRDVLEDFGGKTSQCRWVCHRGLVRK